MGSQLHRQGTFTWASTVGCTGAGCSRLRNFLHDSLSSSSKLVSHCRAAPFWPTTQRAEEKPHLSSSSMGSSKLSLICRNGTIVAVLLVLGQIFHLKIARQISTALIQLSQKCSNPRARAPLPRELHLHSPGFSSQPANRNHSARGVHTLCTWLSAHGSVLHVCLIRPSCRN